MSDEAVQADRLVWDSSLVVGLFCWFWGAGFKGCTQGLCKKLDDVG